MVENNATSQADAALVQFGIFDWIDQNQLQLPDLYEQRLQFLEYADEAGFYCYHLAEHQATPLGMAPSPGVFLAAAIQRTSHIRLGRWSICCRSTTRYGWCRKSVCWII